MIISNERRINMKHIIALFLAMAMVLPLAACGSTDSPSSDPAGTTAPSASTQSTEYVPETTVPIETTAPSTPELASSGDLGDFFVEISGYELTEDYDGNPAVLISYTFTNNSDESTSAMVSLSCRAFQNGIQLDSAFIYNHEKYDSGDSMKDIQPGASIELMEAYVLSSETAPIEFEVEESFSFAGEKLGQLFVISDETSIRLSAAPEGDFTAEVGDYTVSIVSYKLTEDYEGSPAILIELGFTNNSDEPAIFASSVSFSAFQDGIELDTAYIYGDDSGSGTSQMRYIKPGAGATVTKAFVLTSETSVIDIEIEEYFSFSGETIKTEISLEG